MTELEEQTLRQYDVVDFEIVYETAAKEIKPLKEIFEYMIENK